MSPSRRRKDCWPAAGAAALCCALLLAAGCRSARSRAPAPGRPKQRVRLSAEVEPVPSYFVYEARSGDTLYGLGERFAVPWREIAEANDIGPPYALGVGSVVLIPRSSQMSDAELAAALEAGPAGEGYRRRRLNKTDLHRGSPGSSLWWPTRGRVVRSYGDRLRGLPEHGIAIAAPGGTDACAVAAGKVVAVVRAAPSSRSGWGNVAAVSHREGLVSWYAHLDRVLVGRGERVQKGEAIGTIGASGLAPRPVLAFRLYSNERPTNPARYLP